jgi:hypothetical protein
VRLYLKPLAHCLCSFFLAGLSILVLFYPNLLFFQKGLVGESGSLSYYLDSWYNVLIYCTSLFSLRFYIFASLEYDLLNSLTVSLLRKYDITWILLIVATICTNEILESFAWLPRCGTRSISGAYYIESMGNPWNVSYYDRFRCRSIMLQIIELSLLEPRSLSLTLSSENCFDASFS